MELGSKVYHNGRFLDYHYPDRKLESMIHITMLS